MKAVIDRFEGNHAVLILKDSQEQFVIPKKVLPPNAKEGTWLQVTIEDGKLKEAAIDSEETDAAGKRIQEKLEKLRRGDHQK